ncbi:MAG: zinc-binding dehydrogenase [Burkholderiales bacterium]|nr:zinc-binding dehydrogenase [Burkholderiales bacterium]MBK8665489.1 zinc-binding dehydrogenase [Burkholderiales bacterium]
MQMQAVHLNGYGPVENLELVKIPAPQAGKGQFRVKVEYAGLRWSDIVARNAFPAPRHELPYVAGREVAGVIDQVGEGATEFSVGQAVVVCVTKGAWAEYAVVDADVCPIFKIPDGVSHAQALAYPVNMSTAYLVVYTWGQVAEGQTVLLHAAAGGVGLCVLQILKRRFKNVRVIGICGSEEKMNLLKENGCDHVINRKTQDYVEEVNRICGPKATGREAHGQQGGGVDVVLNGVSTEESYVKDMQVVRKRGRWVLFGYPHAGEGMPVIDTGPITYDGITILFAAIYAWWDTPDFLAAKEFTVNWLATEELVPPVQVWPLSEIRTAQRALENGETTGKVVMKVGE